MFPNSPTVDSGDSTFFSPRNPKRPGSELNPVHFADHTITNNTTSKRGETELNFKESQELFPNFSWNPDKEGHPSEEIPEKKLERDLSEIPWDTNKESAAGEIPEGEYLSEEDFPNQQREQSSPTKKQRQDPFPHFESSVAPLNTMLERSQSASSFQNTTKQNKNTERRSQSAVTVSNSSLSQNTKVPSGVNFSESSLSRSSSGFFPITSQTSSQTSPFSSQTPGPLSQPPSQGLSLEESDKLDSPLSGKSVEETIQQLSAQYEKENSTVALEMLDHLKKYLKQDDFPLSYKEALDIAITESSKSNKKDRKQTAFRVVTQLFQLLLHRPELDQSYPSSNSPSYQQDFEEGVNSGLSTKESIKLALIRAGQKSFCNAATERESTQLAGKAMKEAFFYFKSNPELTDLVPIANWKLFDEMLNSPIKYS